jgi:hypothetical protein
MIVAEEIRDGPAMVGQLVGQRQGFAPETRHAWSQGGVEAFDGMRVAGFLRQGLMRGWWNHALGGFVVSPMARGLRTVPPRHLGPQLLGRRTTPVAHVQREDLARLGLQSHPPPLLVRLLAANAPQLGSVGFQPPNDHLGWTDGPLDVDVIGTGRKARDHQGSAPGATAPHSPTDPASREPRAQPVRKQRARLG